MATQDEINHQLTILRIYRRNIQITLTQLASLGTNQVVIAQENALLECREKVKNIKNILRTWKYNVDDHPDDFNTATTQVQINISEGKTILVIPKQEMNLIAQLYPELLKYIVYKA